MKKNSKGVVAMAKTDKAEGKEERVFYISVCRAFRDGRGTTFRVQ